MPALAGLVLLTALQSGEASSAGPSGVLDVRDAYSLTLQQPMRLAPADGASEAPEILPAIVRVSGRPGQLYRLSIAPESDPTGLARGLTIRSDRLGDITVSGWSMMDDGGGDILHIDGRLSPEAEPEGPPTLLVLSLTYE